MTSFSRSESLLLESIEELSGNSLFEMSHVQGRISFSLSDFEPLSEHGEEWAGIEFSAELKECSPRFRGLSCEWHLIEDRRRLAGEFSLPHTFSAFDSPPPQYNDLATAGDRELFARLRIIDSAPERATGEATFLRLERNKKVFELWYQDRYLFDEESNTQGVVRLELDYCGYLEKLAATKGTFGWPLLFADVSLADDVFSEHVTNLRSMVEIFPSVFPQHDYAELRERLEARR